MPRHLRSNRPDGRMPRDERGWRVAPAPDGRGMPEPPARRPPHRSRWFVWLVGLLLAVNFGSVLLAQPGAQPRVKVPFSPYFLSAVQAGRVASIASTANTIQGTFKVAVRYPAQDPLAPPTTLFSTEVPTFWKPRVSRDQHLDVLRAVCGRADRSRRSRSGSTGRARYRHERNRHASLDRP